MKKFIYIFILLGITNFLEAQKLKRLGIEFESTTYSFGDVQMWENQPAIFILKNNSKHAISILPLFSENDLEIIYPENSVKPGETAILKAIYYTSGTGSFTRKFPIYFNTSPEAFELKITGNIKSLSPTAYIQCPMAKPEHSKPKVELFGNVAEIVSDIPLSGSSIKIVGVSNKNSVTFFADQNGNFGSKLPSGNYEVIVEHPNYKPHNSFFFLGQNSGHLKIRLEPILAEPALAVNIPAIPLPKETINDLPKKEEYLKTETLQNTPEKVSGPSTPSAVPKPIPIEQEELANKSGTLANELQKESPSKVTTFDIEENIPPYSEKLDAKETALQQEKIVPPVITPTPEKEAAIPIKESMPKVTTPKVVIPPSPKLVNYTIKVIDDQTFEAIEDAQLYITAILQKKQAQKLKSDAMGMASFSGTEEDLRVIVNADNYISGETIITKGQDDETLIKVFLSPVSNMFEEIYSAKKKEQDNEELLHKLSFNKTEFSFAKKEEETAPPIQNDKSIEELTMQDFETNYPPISREMEKIVVPEIVEEENTKELQLDSMQQLLAKLQAEKLAMEEALAKTAKELDEKEDLLSLKEDEITRKDQELENKDLELEIVKSDYTETQEELEKKKVDLFALENSPSPVEKSEPESLELSKIDYAANNVLFLIDVSSSMGKENKMELLKESIKSLTTVLRDIDRVAIIAYNQKTSVLLESVPGNEKATILKAIDSLETSGLTYGVNGLQNAYELLQYYYIGDGNNQIILATDGLFSSANAILTENELNREVRKQANENGIKLSVVGFGQDKEGEKLMEKLAINGSGQFIQIKNPWEAKTVLIEEIKLNSKR